MADMTFKEFCRQRERICASKSKCSDCELRGIPCSDISDMFDNDVVDEAASIVQKWAQEHPEKALKPSEEKQATPEQAKTYEQGLEDAWELAKKISKMDDTAICVYILDGDAMYPAKAVFYNLTPQEAMQKLQEYENNNSFKAGDIVAFQDNTKAIIMDVESDETVVVLTENSCAESGIFKTAIRKTSRNVSEKLNALLNEIGGKQNGEV